VEPAPRSPVDEAVDSAMRQRFSGAAVPRSRVTDTAAYGTPLSPSAQRALDEVARAAGLGAGQLAGVGSTPRAQARLLVEKLFDPGVGEAQVRAQYGLAGALAAESYRRVRDIHQVLDLNPEQKDSVVDVAAGALIAGGALGPIDDPEVERIDVDPGARVDRARFERAIAGNGAIVRCLRPIRRDDRFYQLELRRRGASAAGTECRDAWSTATIAAQPPAADPRSNSGASGVAGNAGAGGAERALPGAVEVAPLPSGGGASDPTAWKYIVTDGPQGPVVTVAPAR
jgi:hypothetical protein